jgi:hypothetical protein
VLAEYKLKAIKEDRQLFEATVSSDIYQNWVTQAIEDIDFYESRQWTEAEMEELAKVGLKPSTTNLIAMRLDALAGKEVSMRTRYKYKSRSGKESEAQQAEGLSHLAMYLQERNRTSRILSQAKHYARICGLGWHGFDVLNGSTIVDTCENPLDVVWDIRDHTPLMSNQGFVARVKWMTVAEAQERFPKKAGELAKAGNEGLTGSLFNFASTVVTRSGSRWKLYSYNGYWNEKDKEVAVIEFQSRKPATYYRATLEDNSVFVTFDKAEAEKMAVSKKAVVEQSGYKVCMSYFTGSIDLDYMESPYQMDPANGDFLLTPVVHARQILDGVPYGLVTRAKDPQRMYNKKQSKINWMMAARGIIADKMAFDDPDAAAREINRPDYFLLKNPGKDVRIEEHAQQISQHYQALSIHKAEIEQVMGIYDEALGVETNAQSGIAISRRQNASNTTTMFAFDGYNEACREVAQKMLWLIRTVFTDTVALNITDDEEQVKSMRLNETRDGKKVMDVRTGEYDVVVEQIPDSDTMNDIAREAMQQLMMSGIPMERWTPGLLDLMNVPKSATLRKEIEQGLQQRLQEAEQLKAAQQKQIGNGMGPVPMGGGPAVIQPNGMNVQ